MHIRIDQKQKLLMAMILTMLGMCYEDDDESRLNCFSIYSWRPRSVEFTASPDSVHTANKIAKIHQFRTQRMLSLAS